ncbi:DUF975 family protein [Loigolactobacillus coryniformis]|jgi:uncharacterized membrane protein|uniref:DUF975 family protein n=1 Tax=Loigolactobacillus coryniformis TaxID=1610 RepID=UPI00201AA89D|nr:DUF975 family protein [Loigolactobacillus coryniformis]MCL5457095.1 DUF975 family protein [Loigolactobacillus coryniformis]
MTKTRAELKAEAKALLRGHWGTAILLNLIPNILTFILWFVIVWTGMLRDDVSILAWLFQVLSRIVATLAAVGVSLTYLRWLRDPQRKIRPFRDPFFTFDAGWFVPLLVLAIGIYVYTTLWSLLFLIPGLIKSFSYSQAYLIYQDDRLAGQKPVTPLATITRSRELMYGHKMDYFILMLSFLGWDILGVLTLGIGFLWIAPYQSATYAAFYNDLVQTKAQKQTANDEQPTA